jgi:hypothetical protein
MAINPLQLPSAQAFSGGLDFSPLANLGEVYKKAQNEQRLSDLGKQLAAGSIDYKQAAGQVADMGDISHTLQFLALSEQQKKQADEIAASKEFNNSLSGMYGASPSPASSMPNPAPVIGAPRAPIPAPATAGAPVPSSRRVMGDAEGVASGLYDPPAAPGQRPPMQMASADTPTPVAASAPAPATNVSASMPGISPRAIQLIAASGNPRLPQAQRETAKTLLTSELDSSKATSDMKEWAFAKAQDQNTPDFTTWVRANKAAGKTEVNVETKGETAFAQGAGGVLSKRFEKLSEEGQTATQDLALAGQLRDLGAVVKTGAPAAVQGWLAERGIKVGDNVGAVEAYGSIIDKLTPQQRVPGSGSTSDYEGRMFKNSLPKLINTPEGNEIISNTVAGLAQYKLDRAAIAEKALTREIPPADALKQMRELPNPYDNFKAFAKNGFAADPNNPGSVAKPGRQPTTAREVPMTKVETDQSLANARAAVQRNPAARSAIIQKLRDNGIDPSGL